MGIIGILAVVILLLWLGGFVIGAVGNIIHILLIVGLILLVYSFVTGRRVSS